MKTQRLLIKVLIVALIAFGILANRAATRIVEPLDDLQKAIDESNPDDTLVLQASVAPYGGNVIFTKPLKIFANPGAPVSLGGAVEIRGNGATYFQKINFLNNVKVRAGGTISLVQCSFNSSVDWSGASLLASSNTFNAHLKVDFSTTTLPNLEAYDSSFYSMDVTGGKALLKRCFISGVYPASVPESQLGVDSQKYALGLNETAFEGIRLTNRNGIYSRCAGGIPFTLVQSQIGYQSSRAGTMTLTSNKVWLAYNKIMGSVSARYCDSVLIGNQVYVSNDWGPATRCDAGSVKVYNNLFMSQNTVAFGLYGMLQTAELVNNTFYSPNSSALDADGTNQITLKACVFYNNVSAPVGGIKWDISYCVFGPDGLPTQVGVPNPGGFESHNGVDPGFVAPAFSFEPSRFELKSNSICRAAGPPESIYNNRDGTRNDIGFTGGPYYNPASYTNTNPMVYLLTGAPQIFTQGPGRTNIISITAAAVAGN